MAYFEVLEIDIESPFLFTRECLVLLYIAMPKFSSELMQELRTERTEPSVQVQFSSVQKYWAVSSVLGSEDLNFLRTGFEPVRTELSVHNFF